MGRRWLGDNPPSGFCGLLGPQACADRAALNHEWGTGSHRQENGSRLGLCVLVLPVPRIELISDADYYLMEFGNEALKRAIAEETSVDE